MIRPRVRLALFALVPLLLGAGQVLAQTPAPVPVPVVRQEIHVLLPAAGPAPVLTLKLDGSTHYVIHIYVPVGPAPVPVPPSPTPTPTPPGPTPVPPPVPVPPAPAPNPPVTDHLHATLVHILDDPSTAQLRVSDIKAQLAALDCAWYAAPSGSTVADLYKPYSDRIGVPVVYVTNDSGKIFDMIKAPVKPSDVVDRVKALRQSGSPLPNPANPAVPAKGAR